MKYEYKVIKRAINPSHKYKCAHEEAVEDVAERINELGVHAWRLVKVEIGTLGPSFALMERIVTTFGCTTCKEEQPKEQ